MTPEQIELARHALGLDGKRRQSYRNRYCVDAGADFDAWTDLVAKGLAYSWRKEDIGTVGDMFFLTYKGAKKALRKRERLCPEDFPEAKIPVKAFAVNDDDEGVGCIRFAKHAVTARRDGANELDCEFYQVSCRRAPWADQFAKANGGDGKIPADAMIAAGWHLFCVGCGVKIDSDVEYVDHAFVGPMQDFDYEPWRYGAGPVGHQYHAYCCGDCEAIQITKQRRRKRYGAKALRAIEREPIRKCVGVTPCDIEHPFNRHFYINTDRTTGRDRVRQLILTFDFPGSKYGGSYRMDDIRGERVVTIANGDLAAWETWRASIKNGAKGDGEASEETTPGASQAGAPRGHRQADRDHPGRRGADALLDAGSR